MGCTLPIRDLGLNVAQPTGETPMQVKYADITFVKIVASLRSGESIDDRQYTPVTRERLNTLYLAGVVIRSHGALPTSFLYKWNHA